VCRKLVLRASLERATVQIAVREEMVCRALLYFQDIELIPVLKFEPFRFAGVSVIPIRLLRGHAGGVVSLLAESLADSGIIGLMPVERGSWHVPTSEFTDPALLGECWS
jgi:hypothetical protein